MNLIQKNVLTQAPIIHRCPNRSDMTKPMIHDQTVHPWPSMTKTFLSDQTFNHDHNEQSVYPWPNRSSMTKQFTRD